MHVLVDKSGIQSRTCSYEQIEQHKFNVIVKVAYFALLIHILLIPTFAYIGASELAILNVASVIAWIIGIWLIKHHSKVWGIRCFCIEVVVHSIACGYFLGTDAGFQYYLWSISCILMVDHRLSTSRAVTFSCILIFIHALMYVWFADTPYLYSFAQYLPYIEVANVLISGVPMVFAIAIIRKIALDQRDFLAEMATKDYLTALDNRRHAKELTESLLMRAEIDNQPVSIVLADVDNFKTINDTYGHEVGDEVLKALAHLFKSNSRAGDVVSRWGGEEFLIVFPNIPSAKAFERIEQLRREAKKIHLSGVDDLEVSVSFGIVQWRKGDSLNSAIASADAALYTSKYNGRDQTTLSVTTAVKNDTSVQDEFQFGDSPHRVTKA